MNREIYIVMNPTVFDEPLIAFADERDAEEFFKKSYPMQLRRMREFIKPIIYVSGIFSILARVDGDEDD